MKVFGEIMGGFVIVVVIVAAIIGMWFWGSYNTLVNSSSQVDTSYAAIQTQYQRRFDLIPNLAAATKGYLVQEQKVFGDIAAARSHYVGAANGSGDQMKAMNEYNTALSHLTYVVENYPQLKSNETVQSLMDELAGTENRINVARDRYNETTRTYNVLIRSFPKNLIAGMFGFGPRTLFQADTDAQAAPKVQLNNNVK